MCRTNATEEPQGPVLFVHIACFCCQISCVVLTYYFIRGRARMISLLPTADNCSMTVVLVWVGRVGRE